MSEININISGLSDVIRTLENMIGNDTIGGIDEITEAYARRMSAESAAKAPIDTSALRNSIAASPQPSDEPHTWEYGSNLPYAIKMEYEHPENRAYIRSVVWDNKQPYRDAIEQRILRS